MKIIEEIFESPIESINRSKPIVKPTVPLTLNFTHDSFNIAAVPGNVHQTIGIQTTPKTSVAVSPTTSIFESLLPATEIFAQDIEDASDEHVRITGDVFAAIRERKVARYKLRSNLQLDAAEPGAIQPETLANIDAAACQHSTLINRSLANTFERYPDLKKFFVPNETVQDAPLVSHQNEATSTVNAPQLNASSLPSVRLQNIRKLQQHQQLLAQHPQVQRTIDSIRRDAVAQASLRSGRETLSRSYRSEHVSDAIQQAAERFLESVRSPKKRPMAYVEDDAVQQQAEEHLRSVRSLADASRTKSSMDLFRTESSTEQSSTATTSQRSSARSGELLLCTDSGEKTSPTVTTTASSTSIDDVSLKLSRTQSLQTTSVTATATTSDTSGAGQATGVGHSTTSSMEKHMAGLVNRRLDDSAESGHSNCKCLSH